MLVSLRTSNLIKEGLQEEFTFPWTGVRAAKQVKCVPSVNAKAELAPNNRGPEGGLFSWKSSNPFT